MTQKSYFYIFIQNLGQVPCASLEDATKIKEKYLELHPNARISEPVEIQLATAKSFFQEE